MSRDTKAGDFLKFLLILNTPRWKKETPISRCGLAKKCGPLAAGGMSSVILDMQNTKKLEFPEKTQVLYLEQDPNPSICGNRFMHSIANTQYCNHSAIQYTAATMNLGWNLIHLQTLSIKPFLSYFPSSFMNHPLKELNIKDGRKVDLGMKNLRIQMPQGLVQGLHVHCTWDPIACLEAKQLIISEVCWCSQLIKSWPWMAMWLLNHLIAAETTYIKQYPIPIKGQVLALQSELKCSPRPTTLHWG